jgi:hypothetical protein
MFRFSNNPRRPRGSVMILVVAVLGLLAVLGTVYIVASRTQRASSAAMNSDYNFTLARQGVLSIAQRVIGDAMVDSNGNIGGVANNGAQHASRNYDYPETGTIATGTSAYNPGQRNQPWLVAHLHRQNSATVNDISLITPWPYNPATGTYDSALGSPPPLYPYSASVGPLSTVVGDQTNTVTANTDTTLDDPPTANSDAYINMLPFSDVTGVRYRYGLRILDTSRMANLNTGSVDDPASKGDTLGQYLTSLRLAPATADMPYTTDNYFNVGTSNSNGDGTVATNITSLHQNTGAAPSTTAILGRAGFSPVGVNGTFSLASWQNQIRQIENPSDSKILLFDLTEELELRSYGEFGTSYHGRLSTGTSGSNNNRVWPYTFTNTTSAAGAPNPGTANVSGNPRRRSYTTYSFSRAFRPYIDPKTAATPIPDYTLLLTNSPTNNAFALQTPSATTYPLDASNDTEIYPTIRLQQVNVNYPATFNPAVTDSSTNNSMFYVAMTASNIATIMESGCSPAPVAPISPATDPVHPNVYSHDETVQYVANFVAAKTNSMIVDPTFHNASAPTFEAYYLPAGPSFVDNTGICVRAATASGTVPTQIVYSHGRDFGKSANSLRPTIDTSSFSATLAGTKTNLVCLGYAAQPFINEVAVHLDRVDDPTVGAGQQDPVVKDWAIELYNPYNVALSLRGYHLKSTAGGDLDLTGQYVPAGKYLVIVSSTGNNHFVGTSYLANAANKFDPASNPGGTFVILPTDKVLVPDSGLPTTTVTLTLYRPYFSRGNATLGAATPAPDLAPVDETTFTAVDTPASLLSTVAVTTQGTPQEFSIQRGNTNTWGAAMNGANNQIAGQTLGQINSGTTGSGYPLDDRYATSVGLPNGAAFTTINDFNQVLRLCHIFDTADPANPTSVQLLSNKLPTLTTGTTPYDKMAPAQIDSQLHFNFLAAPWVYNTTPSADPASPPTAAIPAGDIRAVHLLEQITLYDRLTDASVAAQVGKVGISGIDLLRLPGQVNLNTASGDVIRALPAIQNITINAINTSPNVAVANILAYRDRAGLGTVKYPPTSANVNTVDYSDTTKYPGIGIRSMAEVLNIVGSTTATDLKTRDQDWSAMLNLCTVRSDTFVVYGFMEAVRANPAYTSFDNASHWYGAVTDDPHDPNLATIPLLRIAQRRWVAIIDRSFSNYDRSDPKFTLPRVVAIKDLPQ